MVGRVAIGEVGDGAGSAVTRIAEQREMSDQLFELAGLRARLLLGRELGEDALTGGWVGGDDTEALLAAAGRVDPGAVLELREGLLAIPTGHDWPPRGTQRDALLRMAAVGNFVPEIVPGERWHASETLVPQREAEVETPSSITLPR